MQSCPNVQHSHAPEFIRQWPQTPHTPNTQMLDVSSGKKKKTCTVLHMCSHERSTSRPVFAATESCHTSQASWSGRQKGTIYNTYHVAKILHIMLLAACEKCLYDLLQCLLLSAVTCKALWHIKDRLKYKDAPAGKHAKDMDKQRHADAKKSFNN